MSARDGYRERVAAALAALGVPAELPEQRHLTLFREAQRLAPVGLGTDGRDKLLTPSAARAWLAMQRHASSEGVDLRLVSAFRSVDFQTSLIRARLDRGDALDTILRVNAPPGYSEHHTGRAVDVGTAGCAALDEAFEGTDAFRWLQANAGQFGFRMSYPRGNRQGYLYEPWHWCYAGAPSRP
ncbi:M15 family metallopeptidase [Fontimonas sp. SYSU GA230001]|uniref:M15 family metallopeptidase n=1 Tax=Fontimonas sp. SYSU GA230001 TaxID=3142450 RepID=UPI0032B560DD